MQIGVIGPRRKVQKGSLVGDISRQMFSEGYHLIPVCDSYPCLTEIYAKNSYLDCRIEYLSFVIVISIGNRMGPSKIKD